MTPFDQLRRGVTTSSAHETQELAAAWARTLPPDCTLALHGNLGVGKTTFVQGLARGFGIGEPVTSPTFTIFTLHRGRNRTLIHLDAYRLQSDREIEGLMLEDFLISPWCLAVEWPERLAPWLPADALHLEFGITPDERHTIKVR
ncbi:MAG: tRNA (adenosine(37)-N6)-threonylcarbamoyltransferase complex ATPase subunit type 1 TsaE [Opitutaceae bacterium]|jgi:tRNA threonylcarbamoyladenosine biosynthesis protein TsaE|nr:tRNA (adenosine(37)-N6)-threonylcarbamoyltransferase complex ATPase subunit type 1 TsaE [Opitutaceae bacterium]